MSDFVPKDNEERAIIESFEHIKDGLSNTPKSPEPLYAVVNLDTNEVYNGRVYTTKKRAYKELPRFQKHEAYRNLKLDIVEYIAK